jgi:hypothetical protein
MKGSSKEVIRHALVSSGMSVSFAEVIRVSAEPNSSSGTFSLSAKKCLQWSQITIATTVMYGDCACSDLYSGHRGQKVTEEILLPGPSGLAVLCVVIHGLTAVAIDCRPFAPLTVGASRLFEVPGFRVFSC